MSTRIAYSGKQLLVSLWRWHMYYADTSVLISYVFASDEGHESSRKILEDIAIRQRQRLYGSTFTLVEVCNTICRKVIKEEEWKLIDPLQRYIDAYKDHKDKCKLLVSLIYNFLKVKLNIEFVDNESLYKFETTNFNKLKIPRIFRESIELSHKLAVRIKDLLHLAYAHALSRTHGIKYFLTRDVEDFEKVKDIVKQLLQIEIVLVK